MNICKEYEEISSIIENFGSPVITNWYVITGAPSSGKTTIINCFKEYGYHVNPDISREYIEGQIAYGITAKELRSDERYLQKILFILMVKNALSLDVKEKIFHDYSLPDNIPFMEIANIPIPEEVMLSAKLFKYKKIFILEPIELIKDQIRTEDRKDQMILSELINKTYTGLGYKPTHVPIMSVKKRVEFIMDQIHF